MGYIAKVRSSYLKTWNSTGPFTDRERTIGWKKRTLVGILKITDLLVTPLKPSGSVLENLRDKLIGKELPSITSISQPSIEPPQEATPSKRSKPHRPIEIQASAIAKDGLSCRFTLSALQSALRSLNLKLFNGILRHNKLSQSFQTQLKQLDDLVRRSPNRDTSISLLDFNRLNKILNSLSAVRSCPNTRKGEKDIVLLINPLITELLVLLEKILPKPKPIIIPPQPPPVVPSDKPITPAPLTKPASAPPIQETAQASPAPLDWRTQQKLSLTQATPTKEKIIGDLCPTIILILECKELKGVDLSALRFAEKPDALFSPTITLARIIAIQVLVDQIFNLLPSPSVKLTKDRAIEITRKLSEISELLDLHPANTDKVTATQDLLSESICLTIDKIRANDAIKDEANEVEQTLIFLSNSNKEICKRYIGRINKALREHQNLGGIVFEIRTIGQLHQNGYEIIDACREIQRTGSVAVDKKKIEFFDIVARRKSDNKLILFEVKMDSSYSIIDFIHQTLGIDKINGTVRPVSQMRVLLDPGPYSIPSSYKPEIVAHDYEVRVLLYKKLPDFASLLDRPRSLSDLIATLKSLSRSFNTTIMPDNPAIIPTTNTIQVNLTTLEKLLATAQALLNVKFSFSLFRGTRKPNAQFSPRSTALPAQAPAANQTSSRHCKQ